MLPLDFFLVPNAVVFGIATELRNRHHHLLAEHGHLLKKETRSPFAIIPWFPPCPAPGDYQLISASVYFPIVTISCQWNHAVCGL